MSSPAPSIRIRELLDWLAPEPDERACLSAIYERAEGDLTLRCASLLIGPPEVAATGWPEWRRAQGSTHPGIDGSEKIGPSFAVDVGSAVVGRTTMTISAAAQWADEA